MAEKAAKAELTGSKAMIVDQVKWIYDMLTD